MSATAKKPTVIAGNRDSRDIVERIQSRKSEELVVAFAGAVGCNLSEVIRSVKTHFEEYGYLAKVVKVSDLIREHFSENPAELPAKYLSCDLANLTGLDRYTALQDLGDELRSTYGTKALAALSMLTISTSREMEIEARGDDKPPRAVYLVDQLKNPAEVELFKLVYGNLFYLVGVLSPQDVRLNQLVRSERMEPADAQALISRDRNDNKKHGQRLEKTIQLADYFVRNNHDNISNLTKPCARFVELVHGKNGITPTSDESGMYAAFSASLKSACLSRQVGAAISDQNRNIISLGWNDVPKFGGGLYSSNDEGGDQRCFYHGGKCYNDLYKSRLITDILAIVEKQVALSPENKTALGALILEETRAGSIIEYSRAIHAEMEAILGLARHQGVSSRGCTLYTTTYPCHNCARHIIAAGIARVVFIEPYEKSLAMELHEDAISSDSQVKNKTTFDNFEGVAPRKYSSFFFSRGDRKDEQGSAIDIVKQDARHIGVEFLDSYQIIEARVVKDMWDRLHPGSGSNPPGIQSVASPVATVVDPDDTPAA
ncbi:deoxycytidylate deaminase [Pseudomonas aeruginosa]|uniref:anti-phage dCTP deaminase n=1 Tax=Pseudomonas aeruginosa TaxID=287 RepID=UPI000F51D257|nr:anti-phage dCTP deaminase [Pseudomonas aeruginosa]RPZ31848.1 deoxycytidylate deaminase [Pseudomonas aeruginosa]RUG75176.1 deoxycytidylate deaminase [Pseudomonas aeruginosa]RUG89420.1 deoxycytidylate deaminase [Pseudomonas aeruginosa]